MISMNLMATLKKTNEAYTLSDVNMEDAYKLRAEVGLMHCKKLLRDFKGDLEKSIEYVKSGLWRKENPHIFK